MKWKPPLKFHSHGRKRRVLKAEAPLGLGRFSVLQPSARWVYPLNALPQLGQNPERLTHSSVITRIR